MAGRSIRVSRMPSLAMMASYWPGERSEGVALAAVASPLLFLGAMLLQDVVWGVGVSWWVVSVWVAGRGPDVMGRGGRGCVGRGGRGCGGGGGWKGEVCRHSRRGRGEEGCEGRGEEG